MSFWKQIIGWMKDPPPSHVFELSEAGVAFGIQGQTGFEPFPPETLHASPLEDNLRNADVAAELLKRIAPPGNAKWRPAALILPDQAVRVSLLDFDSFPSAASEQEALVRFRVKKTIPFDVDEARISFTPLPSVSGRDKTDVLVVTVSLGILARYEALFRAASLHPGEITTSALAALELYNEPGVVILIKRSGNTLTIVAMRDGRPRLYRCLDVDSDVPERFDEELLEILQPTFAFVEDEVGEPVSKLILCGLDHVPEQITLPVEPLQSTRGTPGPFNAGLLGYLEAQH